MVCAEAVDFSLAAQRPGADGRSIPEMAVIKDLRSAVVPDSALSLSPLLF